MESGRELEEARRETAGESTGAPALELARRVPLSKWGCLSRIRAVMIFFSSDRSGEGCERGTATVC